MLNLTCHRSDLIHKLPSCGLQGMCQAKSESLVGELTKSTFCVFYRVRRDAINRAST